MRESQKKFKSPPKRYQPRGLSILYEDHDILVVDKVNGLLTVGTEKEKENTAYYRLTDYVRKGIQKSKNRIFIVHRLDRDTSGILVFAKNEKAKHYLQEEWPKFKKKYYAVVHGTLEEKEGIIASYLAENSIHKMYSVADPAKGKLAQTGYKVLRESKEFSLLEIDLLTGRKNQIRVHFAEKGCPVAGDKLYGGKEKAKGIKRLALHAFSITFSHPHSKEELSFETKIPPYFNALLTT
ncbi:MAG: RNA pseudouridine synthase [Proteobacteria bacterium]|nr:RNA pseudouridine synthase [Pseudomonadota bacterium]MBU1058634.1 RNA pseudouridine synthase [Pseudomonadota bacterium]